MQDSDSEAVAINSVGLPNEAPGEKEPAQGHLWKRSKCPSPANSKRPRTCLAESGQTMVAVTNQRGNPADSCCAVEKVAGRDEEDPKPPLVTSSSVRTSSDPVEEVAEEAATLDAHLPPGWVRTKLEPDW